MNEIAKTLIILGGLLLLGFVMHVLGRRTPLPRVTLLLILGFVFGPSVLDLFPDFGEKWFPFVAHMALVMIGFLLGEKLTLSFLREHGRLVLWISIAEVVMTAAVIAVGLSLIGVRLDIVLLLAGIATATAPAATADVVREMRADGRFAHTLLGIVAVDDALGIVVFSIMLAAVHALHGQSSSVEVLIAGAWELGGALLVGVILGIPMAYLTGRVKPGEPTLAEALGVVFLCGGIAIWLEVSFLLASIVLGTVVANLARHHKRPFHAIEGIEWPFKILFFVLAGASLHIESLFRIGLVGSGYVVFRIIGRFLGAWVGGAISHAGPFVRRWMGMALMPQAGVALGMALVATQHFPVIGEVILPVVIAATVFFELIGPVLTRRALIRADKEADKP